MKTLEAWLLAVWYERRYAWAKYLLAPLTALFCVLSAWKRWQDQRQQVMHDIPVIVVGNITVGGTGKTPVVVGLVEALRQAGFTPGVVSRGFGSRGKSGLVQATDDASTVGDEPLLMVQRTNVPLVVNRQRNQAIATLRAAHPQCNVIISDDGLQHYRMGRAVEIAVLDAQRGLGNGWCLPSGPLRERPQRLQQCDFVLTNGENLHMHGEQLVHLCQGNVETLTAWRGKSVHVVTGIGNPQRFVQQLAAAGLHTRLHAYPDHYAFTAADLQFDDDLPIIMTEKDAVKCRTFAPATAWYLPITAVFTEDFITALLKRLQGLQHG